jgi:hypothetical protein
MKLQFVRKKFAAARMSVVVAVNFGVAFEAHWDCVIDIVAADVFGWNDMVCLNLNAAKSMADAASSVALCEQRGNFVSREAMFLSSDLGY